jgi:tetratricopeptide (TPR) repeat protein
LAVTFEMLGKSSSAKTVIDRIAALYDGDPSPIYAQLGLTYFGLGMYERAEHYYEEVATICPDESASYYNLARVYFAQHKPELAKQKLLRALELAEDKNKKREVLRQLQRIEGEGA